MVKVEMRLVCEPYTDVNPYKTCEEAGIEVDQVIVIEVRPTGVVVMLEMAGAVGDVAGVPPPPETPPEGGVEEAGVTAIGTEQEAVVPPFDPTHDQR